MNLNSGDYSPHIPFLASLKWRLSNHPDPDWPPTLTGPWHSFLNNPLTILYTKFYFFISFVSLGDELSDCECIWKRSEGSGREWVRVQPMAHRGSHNPQDILRQGYLAKRSQTPNRFSPLTYQLRWFCLTKSSLAYFNSDSEVRHGMYNANCNPTCHQPQSKHKNILATAS